MTDEVRNVLFFLDTANKKGEKEERYLSITYGPGELPVSTKFFNFVINFFNHKCDNCKNGSFSAIDITRIIDDGQQVYCDREEKK